MQITYNKLLSQQIVILVGQVLELRTEVALLRGKTVPEAIEEAFAFLRASALTSELFDDAHLCLLKEQFLQHFSERQDHQPGSPVT